MSTKWVKKSSEIIIYETRYISSVLLYNYEFKSYKELEFTK